MRAQNSVSPIEAGRDPRKLSGHVVPFPIPKLAALGCALATMALLTGCHTSENSSTRSHSYAATPLRSPKDQANQALRAAGPKHVLVVTVTKGFRHSSIPTAEKILGQLAEKTGLFTVDYARVEPTDPQFKGDNGKPDDKKVDAAIRGVLAEKMNPAALARYDAVIFANTTGDLPLPDKQAFLDWIKAGHGFAGMHSAADTFDKTRNSEGYRPYVQMLGAEFRHHDKQAEVDCINQDPNHPATKMLPPSWHVKDEIYLMNSFVRTNVHGLLTLDKEPNTKAPGDYPISWCKKYGRGRVFYTSLGHREDVWDPNTAPSFTRENSREVSELYQQHILGGIKWVLGLASGSAVPDKPWTVK